MNKTFEDSYRLRAADFDRWEHFRPSAMLDIFQDIAGRHANILGLGKDALLEKNLVWVIVKVRLRVLRPVKMYDSVRVRTWPLPPERIGYRREYLISDESGNPVVEASSEWVLMDFSNRKIVAGGEIYPLSEFCTDTAFPERFPRLRSFEANTGDFPMLPPWSDFDINGHVNNTKYANYVFDAVRPGEGERLVSFSMEYHREVLPGEELRIITRREGSEILARGENPAGDKMFSCRMEFDSK